VPRANRPWIGLHAGARSPARRWPAEYFASVADDFSQRFDAQVILTGSLDEETIVRSVAERMTTQPINLAGKTSLGGLAALISELDLFVSNDTGTAHIANAVDTPSITIFSPADCRRWAPLDRVRHPIVQHPVECSPCGYWQCPIDHRCLRWVSPDRVIEVYEVRGLHNLRIAAKRLRYTLEIFADVLPAACQSIADELAQIQDELGARLSC
jgi:ADP-heptose:LPS heptosyltransferase